MVKGLALLLSVTFCFAETRFSPEDGWIPLFDGRSLNGWRPQDASLPFAWQVAGDVRQPAGDSERLEFQSAEQGQAALVNGPAGKAANLVSEREFGDVELYLEFLIPAKSNSGVYLQGLYEIQIFDSYGKPNAQLGSSDGGGVYGRFIDGKTVGGTPPRVNASRPPGEWQSYRIWFRAPRFDSAGRMTEKARFVKVEQNGTAIHENVELDGPTRAHMPRPVGPTGPLMLQGDHGPAAYRNIYIRPLE